MSSEMIIEEQINKLNNRINIEKKEIEEIENIIKEIPEEMIQEYSSNKENEDEKYNISYQILSKQQENLDEHQKNVFEIAKNTKNLSENQNNNNEIIKSINNINNIVEKGYRVNKHT
jgi:hypothetical protein